MPELTPDRIEELGHRIAEEVFGEYGPAIAVVVLSCAQTHALNQLGREEIMLGGHLPARKSRFKVSIILDMLAAGRPMNEEASEFFGLAPTLTLAWLDQALVEAFHGNPYTEE